MYGSKFSSNPMSTNTVEALKVLSTNLLGEIVFPVS